MKIINGCTYRLPEIIKLSGKPVLNTQEFMLQDVKE
jgi:hypothetical protein